MKVATIEIETSLILNIKDVGDNYQLQETSTTFEVWAGDFDKIGDIYI